MAEDLFKSALEYHRSPRPGKIEVVATKPVATQRDLSLAYSPGVAAPCLEIEKDPGLAAIYTSRSNLVAVVTNGTAVLGLGDIGALAGKPVMEGKGVLFKNFAGVDVFDIEIDEKDPDRLIDIIASLEPTFGGINLEDIKAPECFYIEEKLRERMKIPIFHDDQHGTAIITAAAVLNALRLVNKKIDEVQLVTSGAGASAIACLNLLELLGMPARNITITDRKGVVYRGRDENMEIHKAHYARDTNARTLADAMVDADIFLGLSSAGLVGADMVRTMARDPIILAMANPTPEIMPEVAREARPDAIIATGRSDYPNQVNNVLCFPFMFRGALDVGATRITDAMKLACVRALADLTLEQPSEAVVAAYGGSELKFGPEYIIPKPIDPRLITTLPPAVARAAMADGVATRPIADLDAYEAQLTGFVFRSALIMQPLYEKARRDRKRIIYAEGEEPRVLQAARTVIDEGFGSPILIGRPRVIEARMQKLGLTMKPDVDFTIVNPESDDRFREFWQAYYRIMRRKGATEEDARTIVRTQNTVIAALSVHLGYADAVICGTTGHYHEHLQAVTDILGLAPGVRSASAMNALLLKKGTFFICDTQVNADPDAETIAEMAMLAVPHVQRFGIEPRAALLSHSNFGSHDTPAARKMRAALELIRVRMPGLEIDGEMGAELALSEIARQRRIGESPLHGQANLLLMPSVDAANIALNLLHVLGDGVAVGPILLGLSRAVHVLTPQASVRRVVNMSALAAADAQSKA
ncbi:MAG: NADP-dependent malic enzyme [Gammaproteobacteria bacterium]